MCGSNSLNDKKNCYPCVIVFTKTLPLLFSLNHTCNGKNGKKCEKHCWKRFYPKKFIRSFAHAILPHNFFLVRYFVRVGQHIKPSPSQWIDIFFMSNGYTHCIRALSLFFFRSQTHIYKHAHRAFQCFHRNASLAVLIWSRSYLNQIKYWRILCWRKR